MAYLVVTLRLFIVHQDFVLRLNQATIRVPILCPMGANIQLTGRISVRNGSSVVAASDMGGILGRIILVRLSLASSPISRDALIDALWDGEVPSSTESVLNATCSRLRKGLSSVGLDGKRILLSSGGSAELAWPVDARVDVRTAMRAIEDAERALQNIDLDTALRRATIAHSISQRDILPGIDRVWIDDTRDNLRDILERTLNVLADVWHLRGDDHSSLIMAKRLARLAPYSPKAAQKIARAHCALSDLPAARLAIRAYQERVSRDLGIDDDSQLSDWLSQKLSTLLARDFGALLEVNDQSVKTRSDFSIIRHTKERVIFPVGWKWSDQVGPTVTKTLCDMTHAGRVLSGEFEVLDGNGTVTRYRPGDSFTIEPDHDMWVVGDEELITDGW